MKQAARASSTSAWPRRSQCGQTSSAAPAMAALDASSSLASLPAERWKSIDTLLGTSCLTGSSASSRTRLRRPTRLLPPRWRPRYRRTGPRCCPRSWARRRWKHAHTANVSYDELSVCLVPSQTEPRTDPISGSAPSGLERCVAPAPRTPIHQTAAVSR